MATLDDETRAARARVAGAVAVLVAVLIAVIVGLIWAGHQNSTPSPGAAPAATPAGGGGAAAPVPGAPGAGQQPTAVGGLGELAGVAAAPMLQFPDSASLPQAMATTTLPAIAVPAATARNPVGVAEGFPPTPQGAVGQLAALETAELSDLNPQTFAQAYRSVSAPGAPAPEATPLGAQVANVYGQLAGASSASSPITSRWQLAGAQIKGTTADGSSVVVCVAGELQLAQERSTETGTGDCQALTYQFDPSALMGHWRIAPITAPSPAPITWPGSDAFTQAGFHPTTGGP